MTTSWSIVPVPTRLWAELVYPDLEREAAYERLWEECRPYLPVDEDDPAAAWMERSTALKANASASPISATTRCACTGRHRSGLPVSSPPPTRAAGDLETVDGRRHSPNLPTEEVFGTPDPERVDGYVSATMPLEPGSIIENIRVEFAGGRALKIDADSGADALRAVAGRDEGASDWARSRSWTAKDASAC